MRKPKPLAVVDFPELRFDRDYRALIAQLRVQSRSQMLRVMLQLLDAEQDGRRQEITLTLPIRPTGPTADFFRACGFDVAVQTEIIPQEVVGRQVRVRFGSQGNGTEARPCSFSPCT